MLLSRVIILAITLFASGCAIQHPTKFNESFLKEPPAYLPPKKIQGDGLVVMTEEEQSRIHSSRAAYLLGSGSEFSFEIGKITKEAALQVFGRALSGEIKVSTSPQATPQTLVIRPSVKSLEWWYRPTQSAYNYQEIVKLELSVVIERNGQRIFEKTYSSGEVAGNIDSTPRPLGTEANKVVHQTILRLLEQAANDFLTQRP